MLSAIEYSLLFAKNEEKSEAAKSPRTASTVCQTQIVCLTYFPIKKLRLLGPSLSGSCTPLDFQSIQNNFIEKQTMLCILTKNNSRLIQFFLIAGRRWENILLTAGQSQSNDVNAPTESEEKSWVRVSM